MSHKTPNLLGEKFKTDRRVRQAKRLLSAALKDSRTKLTKIKPADPKLKNRYQKMVDQCSALRGGQLYYPYLSSGLGNGPFVELADGSVKYDFITGIGVHYFGHNYPKLLDASVDAALEDTIIQGNLPQSTSSLELMDLLVKGACRKGEGRNPSKLTHCFLTSSGAMANENALK